VRIAVVDSGVQPGHPHVLHGQLAAGVAIDAEGLVAGGVAADEDGLGHGTAVTAAIQERAPGAVIVPVRIFGSALRATPLALAGAIDWSVDQGVAIINLSLGSTNAAHQALLGRAVERAVRAGVAVVAARTAQGCACLPGSLPGVLGVELDWDCPRTGLRWLGGEVRAFAAAGYPRPIPGVPQARNLHGISFAVAAASGLAACHWPGAAPESGRVDALVAALRAVALPG
jgi:hypothetical protein